MDKRNIKRREFLTTSVKLAAGAVLLSSGTPKLFSFAKSRFSELPIDTVKLNNGISMPKLGFGTNTLNGSVGERCVAEAISVGYRLLDTAKIYGNEESVGKGIKQSGINRKELFITTKVWVSDAGYENAKKAFYVSMEKLGVDYIDLYLIHRPREDYKGSWKAMEELYKEGKIRAIGVSNFLPNQLEDLMLSSEVKPVINQIETHAFFNQEKSYEYLKKLGIQMEAWSPLAEGRNNIFNNETLASMGKKYNKNNAQVSLRWHYQRGIVAIPRSSQKSHMIENLNIFDFNLDESDMTAIANLDLNRTQFPEWE